MTLRGINQQQVFEEDEDYWKLLLLFIVKRQTTNAWILKKTIGFNIPTNKQRKSSKRFLNVARLRNFKPWIKKNEIDT